MNSLLIDEEKPNANIKILVAEDNETNIRILSAFLAKKGWQVDTAKNGKLALNMLEKEHYDIVLMDALMPEMDGYEAAKLIRTKMPGYADIPIVALTANSGDEEKKMCLEAGMNDFISKPFSSAELYEVIEKHIMAKFE